ncbi:MULTISPECIES: hypothetical protein [Methylobacterium]|jgi:hypothetical protein|uniref:Motility protein n=1 Tax=Methylobacterium longum TaxID=767694 RepID=A0ABT8AWL4_9HYPH|nr:MULTISPECIES: hypothetical protein [Methylobacterium]MCJ2102578.1 hypothetical protein [Methylobacterium sp. E-046]MDN3574357.1 hypothetical protein [Methylobacterium longum]GJE10344.1 hypothetical protein FOHLNKBM_1377 [Methylobacterium longum]
MDPIATTAVQMLAASQNQQIGIAVARQQLAADKAVAGLVADGAAQAASAGPPAPPGQGQSVDLRV